MKDWVKYLIIIVSIFALIIVANEFQIFGTRLWGVRSADAKREVFEHSQSYIEGKRQDLVKYHHEWMKSNSEDKLIIESTIRQSFANFNPDFIIDPELHNFLYTVIHK